MNNKPSIRINPEWKKAIQTAKGYFPWFLVFYGAFFVIAFFQAVTNLTDIIYLMIAPSLLSSFFSSIVVAMLKKPN